MPPHRHYIFLVYAVDVLRSSWCPGLSLSFSLLTGTLLWAVPAEWGRDCLLKAGWPLPGPGGCALQVAQWRGWRGTQAPVPQVYCRQSWVWWSASTRPTQEQAETSWSWVFSQVEHAIFKRISAAFVIHTYWMCIDIHTLTEHLYKNTYTFLQLSN